MDIFKIIGIGIIATILSLLIKNYRPELSITIPIIAMATIFIIIAPYLTSVINMFQDIAAQIGIDLQYMVIVIKIIGVAYITQFGAELCADTGEKAIASKIEFGGKVLIVTMSMPIVYKLLSLVNEIINF
ncbi:MAG: stage III sporulation protein AD [Oscillospiraceae bacterium]